MEVILQFSTTEHTLGNWASKAIRIACHSCFSHIDARMPAGNKWGLPAGSMLGASDSPKAPIIIGNSGGVAVRPENYQIFGMRRQMVLRTDKADAILSLMMDELGKPFDSTSLWDFISDAPPGVRDWKNPLMWFCAEYKTCKLEDAGFFWRPVMVNKNRVSPSDLLNILMMDERWVNSETFWQPVPELELSKGEI